MKIEEAVSPQPSPRERRGRTQINNLRHRGEGLEMRAGMLANRRQGCLRSQTQGCVQSRTQGCMRFRTQVNNLRYKLTTCATGATSRRRLRRLDRLLRPAASDFRRL